MNPTFGTLSDFVTFAFVPTWEGASGFTVLEKGDRQPQNAAQRPDRPEPSPPRARESSLHGKYCWPLRYQQSADEHRGNHGWNDILPGVRVGLVDLSGEGCATPGKPTRRDHAGWESVAGAFSSPWFSCVVTSCLNAPVLHSVPQTSRLINLNILR